MPQLSPEGLIHLKPGQYILIGVPSIYAQETFTPSQERDQVLDQIASHFMANSQSIGHSRGRRVEDLEQLRTDLSAGLTRIVPEVERLNISNREIQSAIREALLQDSLDPLKFDTVLDEFSRAYIRELRSYQLDGEPHRAA